MDQLLSESSVHPWDSNNVYRDKCKNFVSSDNDDVSNDTKLLHLSL